MKGQILISILFLINVICIPLAASTSEIDPLTFYPENDAYISEKHHDSNYGSENTIMVKTKYGGSNWTLWQQDGLISFDLSSLPSNVYVMSAKLYLYYYDYVDNNPKGRTLSVYRLGEPWDETSVTWDNRPTNAGYITINSTVPNSFGWMNWNVTVDVQGYIDDTWDNYGWQICDKNSWGKVGIPSPLFYSKDSNGSSPYLKIEYSFEKPNNPPTADPGGPYSGYTNSSITFNGSNSTDSDGIIIDYRWDFDNDTNWDTEWISDANTSYSYNSSGNYTVVLQVKDNRSGTSSNKTWINITLPPNQLPTANFTYTPYYPVINENITFSDTSNDSDGTIVSWNWTFGDGNTSVLQNPIHSYNATGNYTVNLTVTDNRGNKSHVEKEIIVRSFIRGDVNNDSSLDTDDLVYLIRYIFCNGPAPDPIYLGDINGDGTVDYKDLFF